MTENSDRTEVGGPEGTNTLFTYEPLDLSKRSIRLIQLQSYDPSQRSGHHIRCILHHDTIDCQYACLSYVWGEERDSHEILVNGRLLRIAVSPWIHCNTCTGVADHVLSLCRRIFGTSLPVGVIQIARLPKLKMRQTHSLYFSGLMPSA